ncbi:TPA: hypothetical protein ACKMUG_001864, partial [Neisseria gonorrhoeae]
MLTIFLFYKINLLINILKISNWKIKFIQKWARFGATLNQVPASVFIAGRDAFEPVLQRPRLRQADTDTAGGC